MAASSAGTVFELVFSVQVRLELYWGIDDHFGATTIPTMRCGDQATQVNYNTSTSCGKPCERRRMNRPFLTIVTVLLSCQFTAVPSGRLSHAVELTRYERLSGWEFLFDGHTTNGWRNYQSDSVSDGWLAADGVLTAKRNAGDLITRQQYDHFELVLDYRISTGGNSGLLFHVTEDGKKPWHSGPEVQILDLVHPSPQKAGYLYGLYQPQRPAWSKRVRQKAGLSSDVVHAARPAGEWNQIYLRVCEAGCEIALNGHSYCKFRIGDQEWKRRVKASKFAKFPQFGRAGTGHICLQEHGSSVSFRNIKIRSLSPQGEPLKQPIDGKLEVRAEVAFPNLEWDGWQPIDERGRSRPLRFIELTHAGDDRLFAVAQKGQIFSFQNDAAVTHSTLFLDISQRVVPWRRHNEEGLLGLAFHPDFKQNGYFYVYYSAADQDRLSRVSRFQLSKDNPQIGDPTSELVLMEIEQPFNNHNSGAIEFGRDGFLYIALGDGGDMNDPLNHGQNLSTLLGAVLRINVDAKEQGRNYAIPRDNPFVDRNDARPEIYAFGFRNPWRLAFDSANGDLWLADVGQDLWEEINLVRRGGNYGWSVREGIHPFGNVTPGDSQLLDPIWEYDHRLGRSITGGRVYRGSRVPELAGKYLYADYVTGRVWALEYDRRSEQVIRNLEISDGGVTVTAFGEDSQGEVYYMVAAADGRCIYRFTK